MILRRIILPAFITLLSLVSVLWIWLLHTESGARFVWDRAASATGAALSAQVLNGDLSAGLEIVGIEYRATSVHLRVASTTLSVNIDLLPLLIDVEALHADDITVTLLESQTTQQEKADIGRLMSRLRLPFRLQVGDARLRNIHILGKSAEQGVTIDELRLTADWQEEIRVHQLSLTSPQFTSTAAGVLQLQPSLPLSIAAAVQLLPSLTAQEEAIAVTAQLDGPLNELVASVSAPQYQATLAAVVKNLELVELSRLQIDSEDLRATGSGFLRWQGGIDVLAQLDIAHANIGALTERWPQSHPLSGEIELAYNDSRLAISESQLAVGNTATTASVNGEINLRSRVVGGTISWSELQWPIGVIDPVIASREGNIDLSGSVEDWHVEGRVELAAVGVENGAFSILGGGDRSGAEVNIIDGELLGGTLAGSLAYSWTGNNTWALALDVEALRTTPLLPQWPATLNGHVDASGQRRPFALKADLQQVSGEFLGLPLSADGHLEIAENLLSASGFALRLGDSSLLADGDLHGDEALNATIDIGDIGEFVDDATGRLSVGIDVRIIDEQAFIDIEASSESLVLAGSDIQNFSLRSALNPHSQSLELSLGYHEIGAALSLAGAVDNWSEPGEWLGQIDSLELRYREFPPVTLQQATGLRVGPDRVLVDHLCLSQSAQAFVCAQGEWSAGALLDIDASLAGVPVDLVNFVQETRFTFDQILQGDFTWHWAAGQRSTGNAGIIISAGVISSDDRPELEIRTDNGELTFNVVDGRLLLGELQIPMPGTGHVSGLFTATDVAAGLDSAVEGGIDVDLNDIAVIAALSPLIDEAAGRLHADIDFAGTLDAPRLVGAIEIDDGTLSYQPLGLRLDELQIKANLSDARKITVAGTFLAGDGRGEFHTSADYAETAATGVQILLSGENLKLIDVPDLTAVADVDLELAYYDALLTLSGELTVPWADISPQNIAAGPVGESPDVQVIVGELPGEIEVAPSRLQIEGELSIELGDDVVVDLGVARANVSGKTLFRWNGDPMPLADGRYDLVGDIQVFGQVLEIVEGGVRFANVPAEDPYVRIRAEREIYGNSQVKRAGVLVDGHLGRPTIEAYTNPLTTEERALTLLVTGSDFDLESGAGAIDFGTYIAPRLFVSYGVGLFERDNVISARYDLRRGFGIKATSGQKESGVDFIYRIER